MTAVVLPTEELAQPLPRDVRAVLARHGVQLYNDDCLVVMRGLPDNSVDSIVCDPPYGLSKAPDMAEVLRHWLAGDDYEHQGSGFMGKGWDSFVPGPGVWRECLRVLKPGGHLLAFAGSRTADLMGISIRLAGFEIRDQMQWLYGTGFPKSLNVGKAIDKAAGARREVVRPVGNPEPQVVDRGALDFGGATGKAKNGLKDGHTITAPATPEAQQWDGWGTALKPAHEPIIVARKPLEGTVAQNVLAYGTGAINIDGCRIGEHVNTTPSGADRFNARAADRGYRPGAYPQGDHPPDGTPGRWPANVIMDHEAARVLDEQSGIRAAGRAPKNNNVGFGGVYTDGTARKGVKREAAINYGSGGASRFFKVVEPDAHDDLPINTPDIPRFRYCAEPSGRERDAGLEHMEEQQWVQFQTGGGASGQPSSMSAGRDTKRRNIHSTVKPIALMGYLQTCVTRPGGVTLDPFMGSGTGGCAAVLEGFRYIGIELDTTEGYFEIAQARIAHWAEVIASEHADDGTAAEQLVKDAA